MSNRRILLSLGLLTVAIASMLAFAVSNNTTVEAEVVQTVTPEQIEHLEEEQDLIAQNRSPDVPELPFDDNPDPTACGMPEPWGTSNNVAYLNGIYDGEMFQEEVLLYDSHSRLEVVASAPHGTEVEILMFQNNPVMNYYMVRIPSASDGADEGWIPAALISREPLDDA